MKKSVLSLFVTVVLSISAFSNDDVYLGAGLGIQDASAYDTGFSIVLNGGASIDNIKVEKGYFGLEGEFTHSLLKPSSGNTEVAFTSVAGYLAYYVDVNEDVYAKSKLGLAYVTTDSNSNYDGIRPSLGAAIGFNMEKNISFYTEYTILSSIVSNLTFGIRFKL